MTLVDNVNGLIASREGEDHLVGSRCTTCDTHAFPVQPTCPKCGGAVANTALPRTGTLWSWTVQRIQPKPPYKGPEEFEPFGVGYIDLGPLRIETTLTADVVDAWEIGDAVELIAGDPDDDGNIWSFTFGKVTT